MTLIHTILLAFVLQTPTPAEVEFQVAANAGLQVVQLQHSLPLVNQVVLVPDEATYLDEISKWSPNARWPVLFDDNQLAPMFIRKFRPQRVWRRSSIGTRVKDFKTASQNVIAKAWGGTASPDVAFTDNSIQPVGLVITNKDDHARIAAVALAAGRGQRLRFVESWGEVDAIWTNSETSQRMQIVQELVRETNDDIVAITLCMAMSPRAQYTNAKENPVATTDLIGRDKNGNRFAWCGWIFGSKKHAAYIAACSLFLPRDHYWFCNTYPDSGIWENYGIGNIDEVLPKLGITLGITDGTLASLYEVDQGGISADVIYFTSKGNQDFFELADSRIAPTWIPILNTPAALYFLHSWSLKKPANRLTVGGTWLERGVYAYVGSSHEPMLQAFVPPMEIMRRTMNSVPFLIASRWFAGQGVQSKPWRINTIGDPLMICGPEPVTNRKRVDATERSGCTDVITEANLFLQQAKENPSDASFADAIQTVSLLGKDKIVLRLWNAANELGVAKKRTAKNALPALFRAKAVNAFLLAYRELESPQRYDQDMLWQLAILFPDSASSLLIENIRSVYACDDIRLIAPLVQKTRGRHEVLSIINTYLPKARGRNERELKRMVKQYGT
ncbi:MAG: hypothetical protein H8E91_02380 [Planctomycetes bacterium]|nr:hypothetical protein [Planctomycetota bacterium]